MDKNSHSIKEGFDSEPVYNEKNLKIKMKSYKGKNNKNFHDHLIQGPHSICLSVLLTDFVFKISKNYYQQVFLEKCKYIVKGKKISR